MPPPQVLLLPSSRWLGPCRSDRDAAQNCAPRPCLRERCVKRLHAVSAKGFVGAALAWRGMAWRVASRAARAPYILCHDMLARGVKPAGWNGARLSGRLSGNPLLLSGFPPAGCEAPAGGDWPRAPSLCLTHSLWACLRFHVNAGFISSPISDLLKLQIFSELKVGV